MSIGNITAKRTQMLERLQAFIQKHRLLEPGETIAVGYSGGPDSTCCLALLIEAGYSVIAAHLNHAQRPEADEEQAKCEETARRLGAEFVASRQNVPAIASSQKIGIEEAGRQARYRFFEEVSKERGGIKVATAHTLDDHVETILFHLARGSGMAGLAGIPHQRGNIIRPLLWARREETRNFCAARNFWVQVDPANLDPRFSRVKARLSVVPAFEALHPGAMVNAARSALILSEENALLDALAAAGLEGARRTPTSQLHFLLQGSESVFDAAVLRELSPPLLRRAVRLTAESLGRSPTFEQAQIVAEALASGTSASITLEDCDTVIEAHPKSLRVRRLKPPSPFLYTLPVPGEIICEQGGWRMSCQQAHGECHRQPASLDIVLDSGTLRGQLQVRTFSPGDRIVPLGSGYERKIQDVLTDAKVSANVKARLPIVYDAEGAVWVPGVCIADRVKVTAATKKRLNLKFGPL